MAGRFKRPLSVLETPQEHRQAELIKAMADLASEKEKPDPQALDDGLYRISCRFGDEVYERFFTDRFHLELSGAEAKEHWDGMLRHHQELCSKLGDVDFVISSLDYLTRKAGLLRNPAFLESDELAQIREDTMTDALTGLFNVRHFKKGLERELARAGRVGEPVSLILFDVDHFKLFNDLRGHPAGDEALNAVAHVLKRSVRRSDLACRYGGEEFALILPATNREGAKFLAERIRARAAKIDLPEARRFLSGISLSGGIASFPDDAKSAEELLARADQALYAAKEGGRNRVELFSPDRRKAPRKAIKMSAIHIVSREHRDMVAVKDLSERGLLLEMSESVLPGKLLNLELLLPERSGGSVTCVAEVVHVSESKDGGVFLVGAKILKMSHADQTRFTSLLAARQAA